MTTNIRENLGDKLVDDLKRRGVDVASIPVLPGCRHRHYEAFSTMILGSSTHHLSSFPRGPENDLTAAN